MCAGSEFQVDGAETENAREVKLLVMPEGRACLDQLVIAIRSFTLLRDHSRSKTRLITIMSLIAKPRIIYATACHASLCTTALDCLSVSCHCRRTVLTNTARGGGGGD